MKDFVWVLDQTVIAIHEEQLAEHGGLSGVRDSNAVLVALSRPKNKHAYEACDDIAELAAAYIYSIAKNHRFADGNKRTSLVLGDLFLMLNGYELTSTPVQNVLTIVAVADGSMSEENLSHWIRENMKKQHSKITRR
ncbi:MAG: type II toxin-antitoxin system death-on-curing family toxin [Gammaproteobacteria bacterium]|nr:MAG: type II toxin-antitoxin system death-on-curing family toxin [Gammaproteobacteria bacterium]